MDQQEKLRQIAKITAQIGGLPKGYISKKQINGKVYYYHQWSQSGVKHSKYLRDNEIEPLAEQIEQRKSQEALPKWKILHQYQLQKMSYVKIKRALQQQEQ